MKIKNRLNDTITSATNYLNGASPESQQVVISQYVSIYLRISEQDVNWTWVQNWINQNYQNVYEEHQRIISREVEVPDDEPNVISYLNEAKTQEVDIYMGILRIGLPAHAWMNQLAAVKNLPIMLDLYQYEPLLWAQQGCQIYMVYPYYSMYSVVQYQQVQLNFYNFHRDNAH